MIETLDAVVNKIDLIITGDSALMAARLAELISPRQEESKEFLFIDKSVTIYPPIFIFTKNEFSPIINNGSDYHYELISTDSFIEFMRKHQDDPCKETYLYQIKSCSKEFFGSIRALYQSHNIGVTPTILKMLQDEENYVNNIVKASETVKRKYGKENLQASLRNNCLRNSTDGFVSLMPLYDASLRYYEGIKKYTRTIQREFDQILSQQEELYLELGRFFEGAYTMYRARKDVEVRRENVSTLILADLAIYSANTGAHAHLATSNTLFGDLIEIAKEPLMRIAYETRVAPLMKGKVFQIYVHLKEGVNDPTQRKKFYYQAGLQGNRSIEVCLP